MALLVVAVVAVHACVTVDVAARLGASRSEAAMPPRIEVAYVREMKLADPPPTAAPAAPAAPVLARAPAHRPAARRGKAPAAASAASAPEPAASEPKLAAVEPAASATAPIEAATAPDNAPVAVADAASAAASGAGPAFQWPVSTRVRYHLSGNYRGQVDGNAQVEWIRDGARYQVHVDFLVGPSFAPVITQRSTSDGDIGPTGLMPRRYDQQIRLLGSDRPLQTVLFDPFGVTLANGERQASPPNVQDSASQFIQLTYLFSTRPELLVVGGSVDIPLALPKKVDTWTYDVTEQVTLDTPFGALQALHLVPRNPPGPGALRVEIWFAPQLRYFPARLRFEQNESTYVDLMIEKPPEMAN